MSGCWRDLCLCCWIRDYRNFRDAVSGRSLHALSVLDDTDLLSPRTSASSARKRPRSDTSIEPPNNAQPARLSSTLSETLVNANSLLSQSRSTPVNNNHVPIPSGEAHNPDWTPAAANETVYSLPTISYWTDSRPCKISVVSCKIRLERQKQSQTMLDLQLQLG